MLSRQLCLLFVLIAACGDAANAGAGSVTTLPAPPPTDSEVPAAALTSYRFTMSVGLTPDPPDSDPEPLWELSGEATTAPPAMRVLGQYFDDPVSLVSDGSQWWDLEERALGLSSEDIRLSLTSLGFLLPDDIIGLLDDTAAWEVIGVADHLGVPVTQLRRQGIRMDLDWPLGDLIQLDVWQEESGDVVKFTAWFATGDDSGFPVASWEITERNPKLTISLPTS